MPAHRRPPGAAETMRKLRPGRRVPAGAAAKLGWIEGRNVRDRISLGRRPASIDSPDYAAELVALAGRMSSSRQAASTVAAAAQATRTIPIVFTVGGRSGRQPASSRAWRGRAATSPGFSFIRIRHERQMAGTAASEIAPSVTRVAVLRESAHMHRDQSVRAIAGGGRRRSAMQR